MAFKPSLTPADPNAFPVPPPRKTPRSAVRRLSLYLRALERRREEGESTVSSGELGREAGTTAAQVRKDLSSFGSFGTRGLGYPIGPLEARLRTILGLDREWEVVLVGAGRIGSALYAYPHFRERGFRIQAVVDDDPAKVGRRWGTTHIQPLERLEDIVRVGALRMAVLAVPEEAAQEVADRLVDAGILGILNFAPTRLQVPEEVEVNDVNLALELEALSFALISRIRGGWEEEF